MARKRRQSYYSTSYTSGNRWQRDTFDIASGPSFTRFAQILSPLPAPIAVAEFDDWQSGPLTDVEDGRRYHPARKNRPASSSTGRTVTKTIFPKTFMSVQPVMQFNAPSKVAVCIRRKVRDQVLHALKKTGRGSGRPKRFTRNSTTRC